MEKGIVIIDITLLLFVYNWAMTERYKSTKTENNCFTLKDRSVIEITREVGELQVNQELTR